MSSEIPRNTVYGKFSLYEAQKWLRKKKGMLLQPTYLELSNRWICVIRDNKRTRGYSTENQETYEDSLTAGINECIKLLKNYELEMQISSLEGEKKTAKET